MATPQAMFQQMSNEFASARAQIVRISSEMDVLRTGAQAAIAASEARSAALFAQMRVGSTAREERFDIVDFKVAKPDSFYGKREES